MWFTTYMMLFQEMIEALRESIVHMVHTRDGARVAMQCVWHGTAKVTNQEPEPEVTKLLSYSTLLSMKFFLFMLSSAVQKESLNCWYLISVGKTDFILSWFEHEKKFYKPRPRVHYILNKNSKSCTYKFYHKMLHSWVNTSVVAKILQSILFIPTFDITTRVRTWNFFSFATVLANLKFFVPIS